MKFLIAYALILTNYFNYVQILFRTNLLLMEVFNFSNNYLIKMAIQYLMILLKFDFKANYQLLVIFILFDLYLFKIHDPDPSLKMYFYLYLYT